MPHSRDVQPTDHAPPRVPVVVRVGAVLVGALLGWLAIAWLGDLVWDGESSLARHVASAVLALAIAGALVLGARRLLDRRPLRTLGLSAGRRAATDVLLGAASWLLPAAVGLGVATAAGLLRVEVHGSVAEAAGVVLLLVVLVLVYEAFPEELIFRGYVYRNLAVAMAPWLAVLVQAALFAAFGTGLWVVTHGWDVLSERLGLFLGMGVVTGCVRLISGSVWATVGWHLAFQVVMQLCLSSQYLDVTVSDEGVFLLSTAVVAFVASPTLAGLFWRGPQNWGRPEPDPRPEPAAARAR